MEIIETSIKCTLCQNVLDSPVILPCGESICSKHVEACEKERLYCLFCQVDHVIPESGNFPCNRRLDAIIKTRLFECNVGGVEYTKAALNCQKLNKTLSEFEQVRLDPLKHIAEVVEARRNEVNLMRSELKLRIDDQAERILHDLDEYEKECALSVNKEYEFEVGNDLEAEIRRVQVRLEKWLVELNVLKGDETKWEKVREESEKMMKHLELKLNEFKNDLMLNRSIEFEMTKSVEFMKIISKTKRIDG